MTQTELFKYHRAGNLTIIEPNLRLAHGQENTRASSSRPPMPAPANFGGIAKRFNAVDCKSTASCFEGSNPSPATLPPFARNSDTSKEAAVAKCKLNDAGNQRESIFDLIQSCEDCGATREEVEDFLQMSGNTVRPRIKELLGESKGYIVARIRRNGETRKTKSGLNAEVLVVS